MRLCLSASRPQDVRGSHADQIDTESHKIHSAWEVACAGATGGKKTLAHPDYEKIQSMWHPTLNQGKQPADFSHKSNRKVWLRCPGCRHGCGRQHEWSAEPRDLTRNEGYIVCPYCESMGGHFCECQSVAAEPSLCKQWHPDNPPARQVAKSSSKKYRWVCSECLASYEATCNSRCTSNSGCPVCGDARKGPGRHPKLSEGRLDLADEWVVARNDKSPGEVTLGSHYPAWWQCSRNSEHPPWQARVFDRATKGTGCPKCRHANRSKPRKFGSTQ